MIILIDKLFKSDLVGKPSRLYKITSIIIVVAIWILVTMLYYYSLPIDTISASENFIYDKAEIGFNEYSRQTIGYINIFHSFSKEQPQIVVYTDNEKVLSSEIDKKANDIFNEIGIGSAEYNNGVLIYLTVNPEINIRIEVGYGLEDVINDAKAGMLLDDNIKKVNDFKPLTDFDNTELESLVLYIFKDINIIINEKYGITPILPDIQPIIYDNRDKDAFIYPLVILSIIIYMRCLKYRYVYKLIFYPFIILSVVLILADFLLYYIIGIVTIFGSPIVNSDTMSTLIAVLFFIYPVLFNIVLYTTSTDKALLDKDNDKVDKEVNDINNDSAGIMLNAANTSNTTMPYAKALLKELFIPPKNKSYFQNLPHRFLLNYSIIFALLYITIFYIMDIYGYNIFIILLLLIILAISIFLFIKIKSCRVPISYALYLSLIAAPTYRYNQDYRDIMDVLLVIMFFVNIISGFRYYRIGSDGSGFRSRRRGSFTGGGRSGGFSSSRGGSFRGGGRSGGGGARR